MKPFNSLPAEAVKKDFFKPSGEMFYEMKTNDAVLRILILLNNNTPSMYSVLIFISINYIIL